MEDAKHMDATPAFYVDFNEMVEADLVLLSQSDERKSSDGEVVTFREGMSVRIFMDDPSPGGEPEFLTAEGKVEPNLYADWSGHVRWLCRISSEGIRRVRGHAPFAAASDGAQ